MCEKGLVHASDCVTLNRHNFMCKWAIKLTVSFYSTIIGSPATKFQNCRSNTNWVTCPEEMDM